MKSFCFNSLLKRNLFLNQQILKLSHYPYFCLLQTVNSLNELYPDYEYIIGASNYRSDLKKEDFDKKKWLLGGFSYNLKAQLEPRCSNYLKVNIPFPDIAIFEPEIVYYVKHNEPLLVHVEGKIIDNQCNKQYVDYLSFKSIETKVSYEEYSSQLQTIFEHLKRGDIYEVNYAIEYLINDLNLNPIHYYNLLTQNSPTPQAGILKWEDKWLFCASQERFLKKTSLKLISQPIKGTTSHNLFNEYKTAQNLFLSTKNRSENVMIVDLVRNDMNRCCYPGTVQVERLYQIQTYQYLHQMVSTIVGKPQKGLSNYEIISSLFPAGSMTGCPKIRAMQIIESIESSGRGIYAGSIGYFHNGNFDFNVVIRSLVWNESLKLGSFHTGGAITLYSEIPKEYEECQLKAKAIINSFKYPKLYSLVKQ